MKRRSPAKSEPVISPEILEQAKRALFADQLKPGVKCSVCGAEAPRADEPLCWVCKRLKISAWRDLDQQMPMQE
jgi:hypothetical protein